MPFVRVVYADVGETIEIVWARRNRRTPNTIDLLTERHTAPPEETWKARQAAQTAADQAETKGQDGR